MKHIAWIRWIKHSEGGRKTLPVGQYSTAALFKGHDEAWSVVLNIMPKLSRIHGNLFHGEKDRAYVRFLSPDAPHDWIAIGAHFELFEGSKKVAIGRVMETG